MLIWERERKSCVVLTALCQEIACQQLNYRAVSRREAEHKLVRCFRLVVSSTSTGVPLLNLTWFLPSWPTVATAANQAPLFLVPCLVRSRRRSQPIGCFAPYLARGGGFRGRGRRRRRKRKRRGAVGSAAADSLLQEPRTVRSSDFCVCFLLSDLIISWNQQIQPCRAHVCFCFLPLRSGRFCRPVDVAAVRSLPLSQYLS